MESPVWIPRGSKFFKRCVRMSTKKTKKKKKEIARRMKACGSYLHVAHGDAVVINVTDHLVLDFLPPLEGFLNENLGRNCEGLLAELQQFLLIVAKARAKPAKGKSRTHDQRISNFTSSDDCPFQGGGRGALGTPLVDLEHGLGKELSVFGENNCFDGSSQNLIVEIMATASTLSLRRKKGPKKTVGSP